MPGPVLADPTPDWLKPENASVTDTALTKAMRMIGHLIGADNPTAQVLGLMMTDVPGGSATGGLAKAVEGLKARVIKAYHGSPHDFERFSLEKIGTGEGAQAYGHGLYFAENPAVASGYKERLSAAYSNTPQEAAQMALKAHGDRKVAAEKLADRVNKLERAQSMREEARALIDAPKFNRERYDKLTNLADQLEGGALATHPAEIEKLREAAKILASGQPLEGRMYEVAIHADPEDFLDWDKPLSQQSEKVKAKLSDLGFREGRARDPHGETIYDQLKAPRTTAGYSPAATENLKQAGIPGIKYLDQGSRGTHSVIRKNGEWGILKPDGNEWLSSFSTKEAAESEARRLDDFQRTRNYVVFDDRLIDILKKYGLLLPAAGGAGQATISRRSE